MSFTADAHEVEWQAAEVTAPQLEQPVAVVAARDIPYMHNANRFQTLSIYLPATTGTGQLIGSRANALPDRDDTAGRPRYQVHIHGGAWRDPELTSRSIEPTVAHTFSTAEGPGSLRAIASLNYTISPFPTHPSLSYDPIRDNHTDLSREGVHPQHVSDVLHGLALLRGLGLTDGSYILSGHSCGACLAFQAILQPPSHYGLGYLSEPPEPAAILGLNGLYDLLELVDGLDASHQHLRDDYEMFLSNAFGQDKTRWPDASPARFEPEQIAQRIRQGRAPQLVVLDQSAEDQLVPMNQKDRFKLSLGEVAGLQVVDGHRCSGRHASPWEQGDTIWESVRDVFGLLDQQRAPDHQR